MWADICAGCYKQPRYIFTGRKSSKAAVFCGARWLVAGGGWSRRLSQCEERAVIDCYTPTRNLNWDTHTQFDARSFRTSSVTPPYPCLCPNEAFIRNSYLTNNQGEPHHANAKLSQDSRPTFNEPVRSGSPSPPPLLPGTWPGQRGLII